MSTTPKAARGASAKGAKKNSGPTKSASSSESASSRSGSGGRNPTVEMVRQLARILDNHNLSELILKAPEANVTLRRGNRDDVRSAALIQTQPAVVQGQPMGMVPQVAMAAPAPAEPAQDSNLHSVTSPFVGTFYRSPNPESPPYVELGARVERGQPLCIVEAMKLMNEIEADKSGVVTSILVEDGDPVEYGQALFKISPA